ncbi:MAG: hypothetical protein KQJ78_11140 [Deltaproteobacteria bacterium]|nr:hypothetical protein [Deltaproteobacteria bacterium]
MSKNLDRKEGLPALADGRGLNFIERDGDILFTAEALGLLEAGAVCLPPRQATRPARRREARA